jgi:hypothetical protein
MYGFFGKISASCIPPFTGRNKYRAGAGIKRKL